LEDNQALIGLDRRAHINYEMVRGDTFAPPTVSFKINGNAEDFSASVIRGQIRKDGVVKKDLSEGSGITVGVGTISYRVEALEMLDWVAGIYEYDVEKDTSGLVETIQYGQIILKPDTTI